MKKLSWANFILGLWLLAAPFALVYRGVSAALLDNVIVGVIIAVLAVWRALGTDNLLTTAVSWIVAILGLWTLVAPFVLHYAAIPTAMWNNVIVGIVVAIFAIASALDQTSPRFFQQHRNHAH